MMQGCLVSPASYSVRSAGQQGLHSTAVLHGILLWKPWHYYS